MRVETVFRGKAQKPLIIAFGLAVWIGGTSLAGVAGSAGAKWLETTVAVTSIVLGLVFGGLALVSPEDRDAATHGLGRAVGSVITAAASLAVVAFAAWAVVSAVRWAWLHPLF